MSKSKLRVPPRLFSRLIQGIWCVPGLRSMLYYTILHYTALQCTALLGTALHCTALLGTALHCTALHCTALHCTALHCPALHCTALHFTALHCTILHCTALLGTARHCSALHCNTQHCTNGIPVLSDRALVPAAGNPASPSKVHGLEYSGHRSSGHFNWNCNWDTM